MHLVITGLVLAGLSGHAAINEKVAARAATFTLHRASAAVPAHLMSDMRFQLLGAHFARTRNCDGCEAARISGPDTVWYVNSAHHRDLSEFGTGNHPAADLLRFSDQSPLLTEFVCYEFGLAAKRKPGWSAKEEEAEGHFVAEFSNMLLKSRNDEAAFRRSKK